MANSPDSSRDKAGNRGKTDSKAKAGSPVKDRASPRKAATAASLALLRAMHRLVAADR